MNYIKPIDVEISTTHRIEYATFIIKKLTENELPQSRIRKLNFYLLDNDIICDELNVDFFGYLSGMFNKDIDLEYFTSTINDFIKNKL